MVITLWAVIILNHEKERIMEKPIHKYNYYYSKEDDGIIADCVRSTNLNINLGCEIASKKLGKSHRGVIQRYYNKVRYTHAHLFVSIGGQAASNTKNVFRGREITKGLELRINNLVINNYSISTININF